MFSNSRDQTLLQPPASLRIPQPECIPVSVYVDLCLEAGSFEELSTQLEKTPLPLRVDVYETLHIHFQSKISNSNLDNVKNSHFSNISLFGLFFGAFNESSTIISTYVTELFHSSYSLDQFKQHFSLIPLNLRAEVHSALFHKALWSASQMVFVNFLDISKDVYGVDIQLTEADTDVDNLSSILFEVNDQFSFITQFRNIPLQYRGSVLKCLLYSVKKYESTEELSHWISMISAADLYLDLGDIVEGISNDIDIFTNAWFDIPFGPPSVEKLSLKIPAGIGGQVYQAICCKLLSTIPHNFPPLQIHHLCYLKHKLGPLHQLDTFLNAPNYDAFITQVLAIPHSQRIQIHNDLYFYTKSDLVKYKEQFDWVLQSACPHYFLDQFDVDSELETELETNKIEYQSIFFPNFGSPFDNFSGPLYTKFTQLSPAFQFESLLALASRFSHQWISSCTNFKIYIDCLFPHLVTEQIQIKQSLFQCLVATDFDDFYTKFHGLSIRVSDAIVQNKDNYCQQQKEWIANLDSTKSLQWYINAAQEGQVIAQSNLGGIYQSGRCGVVSDVSKAIEWFAKAAQQGHAPALYNLGLMFYYGGECVAVDFLQAFGLFTKSAQQGFARAQHYLGLMYECGKGVGVDFIKADEWYTKSAQQGHADAQHCLGLLYHSTQGVTADLTKSVEWYTKAAQQGYTASQHHLGVMYHFGQGIAVDFTKAIEMYTKASQQPAAQFSLGTMYQNGQGVVKDFSKAFELFTKSAEQGYSSGQFMLGLMYKNGEGVDVDFNLAFEWSNKAAQQGNFVAQFNVGLMYKNGEGVDVDFNLAFEWFLKAALQGHTASQFNVGLMYKNGHGVVRDFYKAFEWFDKAAYRRQTDAQYNLAIMYQNGQGVDQNLIQAIGWYTHAAEKGLATAQYKLGLICKLGQLGNKNFIKAADWFTKAALQGDIDAQYNLALMHDKGQGVAVDSAQAFEWFTKAAQQGCAGAQFNLGLMHVNGQVVYDRIKALEWFSKAAKQGHVDAQSNFDFYRTEY